MKKKFEKVLLVAAIGPFGIGESFLRALGGPGRETDSVNILDYFPLGYGRAGRLLRRIGRRRLAARYNRAIREKALRGKPDLILVNKGNLIRQETLSRLRRQLPGTLLVNVNYDDFFSPSPGNRFPDLEGIVPLYHWIFPAKRPNVEELLKLGAERVHYLPLGYDEAAHFPVRPSKEVAERYGSQLTFAGTYTPVRARLLSALDGFSLSIWGAYWNRAKLGPELRREVRRTGNGRIVRGAELSAILNSSRIGLNFLRAENRDTHNHRSFELPACGVFTLSERSEELGEFFAEGKEIAFFSSPEELREKALYYLEHDRERETAARAGYRRVKEGKHAIRDRVERMMEIMGLE
ncbi:MAG: glycosyltransferase [Candidatus Erginobacter occultus]|nr:glycosyltransferase [Candidatus Erginobacter occultus]